MVTAWARQSGKEMGQRWPRCRIKRRMGLAQRTKISFVQKKGELKFLVHIQNTTISNEFY